MRIGIGAEKSGYWVHLVDYIQRKNLWQVELFTDEKKLWETLQRESYDFLFLEHGMCQDGESNVPVVYFGEGAEEISCYQSRKQILEEMRAYVERGKQKSQGKRPLVYGVYSPLGRSGKTSFSLAFARRNSFFYMGMEEYGIKGKERDKMGELLYHIHNRKEHLIEVMKELSEEWQGIQCIPSPMFFSDVHLLQEEDFQWFTQEIRNVEEMPSVIIDFGIGSLDHIEVLRFFDRVYVPVLPGDKEAEKIRQFQELFQEVSGDTMEKMHYIQVPNLPWQEEGFLEQVVELEGKGWIEQAAYLEKREKGGGRRKVLGTHGNGAGDHCQ